MSDTYTYEVLEPGGHARLVGNVLDRISSASANPASAAGSATGILGDAETASWMGRTTAADGAALVDAVYGNTLRWNQLVGSSDTSVTVPSGHKYLSRIGGTAAIGTSDGAAISVTGGTDCIFDLTAMFGAGNEPATVAEFEALFPEPYYPYDAGSLLPVRMTGVETVGFNQWDGTWENGAISSTTGQDEPYSTRSRSFYIPVFPNTEYYHLGQIALNYYDSNKNFLGARAGFRDPTTFTTPVDCHFIRFMYNAAAIPSDTICINLSDPARNGTYEPYWRSERAIPASTYFPQGMRSAGSVRDELRADAAVTRVGERAYQSGDESDTSVVTDGTVTHYALATPTTTPIDPPLPMSYRTGAGGTERVMVASGTQSAPPVFATRYPLTPEGIRDRIAATVAPVEQVTAQANHAIGELVYLGWSLYKVTSAIATGETITPGTNVTETTVAAELAALSE